MAITNFIPTVWSENLYQALEKQYIGVAHCNREFEGDIKEKGNVVKICGIGDVLVSDYTKNTNMTAPQTLSDTARDLVIDQAKYFNFQLDDVDRTQSNPHLMELAMKNAANALANAADKYVFQQVNSAGHTAVCNIDDGESVVRALIDLRTKLLEKNVNDPEDIIIEVSPAIAKLIMLEKLSYVNDTSELIEKGCIGNIYGCKVYVSNNVMVAGIDDYIEHKCMIRTKRAIAFAEQLSEIEAYRPELRFADAVKGLHLYGAKVVYPQEVICLKCLLPIEEDEE